MDMVMEPIGHVRNNINASMREGWEEVASEIILNSNLEGTTEGLEQFSHIIVLFWMHQIPRQGSTPTKVHPKGRQELPLVGLFATRSPQRPNPIGLSVVRLLECQGNTLMVKGLDAINGTPVVDIKPYLPRDLVVGSTSPEWVAKL
jgi:tRNA-Thr(GGU) m(6)t(6)A37 methyltransferase TsaA